MKRVRRRIQVHLRHRGELNRKGRKRMRELPDFGGLDDFLRGWRESVKR